MRAFSLTLASVALCGCQGSPEPHRPAAHRDGAVFDLGAPRFDGGVVDAQPDMLPREGDGGMGGSIAISILSPNDGDVFSQMAHPEAPYEQTGLLVYDFTVTSLAPIECGECPGNACCNDDDDASCGCPAGMEAACCADVSSVFVFVGSVSELPDEIVADAPPPGTTYRGSFSFTADFPAPLLGAHYLRVEVGDYVVDADGDGEADPPASAQVAFRVDAAGPAIVIGTPVANSLVGGVFAIVATITDDSGIDPDSVVATVNGIPVADFAESGATYEGQFDVAELPGCNVSPQIEVTARDGLGNTGTSSIIVSVDTVPPLAELDPAQLVAVRNAVDGEEYGECCECSRVFDPVGEDAVDDGECVLQVFEVRARIEDSGSTCPGAEFGTMSGIDDATVELIAFQPATLEEVLVTDTNGDGICDAINPELGPADYAVTSLGAIGATGSPDWRSLDPGLPNAPCPYANDTDFEPEPVCDTTPATYVITNARAIDDPPAIFAIPPVGADEIACMGQEYDSGGLGSELATGWTCLALRVRDVSGNRSVSKPIRVFVDKTGDFPPGTRLQCAPNVLAEGPDDWDCEGGPVAECDTCCDEAAFWDVSQMPVCATCASPTFPEGEAYLVD